MRVYLAAPLFCEAEREFNRRVAGELRGAGFEVWVPQESLLMETGSREEKRAIFEADVGALRGCDVVVAVLDGACVDCGVAFEIGYAAALGKPVVGLKTDHRVFSWVEEVNLVLEVAMRRVCRSMEGVIGALREIGKV
ncbi:MAG: nucleoside 2-deoxyribosyltransferase [Candidatus Freyarchaeota archaeon]